MGKEVRNQKDIYQYQYDRQVEENKRQESYNAEEWQRQFDEEQEAWQRQFQAQVNEQMRQEQSSADEWTRQQEYMSPENQVKRLQTAGINPAVYFGGSGSMQGGVSVSSPSASTPSLGSPSVQGRSGLSANPGNPSQMPMILNALNQTAKAVSDIGLQGSEKRRIDTMLGNEVSLQIEQIQDMRLKNAYQHLFNDVYKAGMPAHIQRAGAELANLMADTLLKSSQSSNFDADTAVKRIEKEFKRFELEYAKERKPYELSLLKFNEAHALDLFRETMRNNASKRALESAQANQANAQAKTENEFRSLRRDILEIKKEFDESNKNFDQASFADRLRGIVERNHIMENEKLLQKIQITDQSLYTSLQRLVMGKANNLDLKHVINGLSAMDTVFDQNMVVRSW